MDFRPDSTVATEARAASTARAAISARTASFLNPSGAMISLYLSIVALLVAIGVTMVFSASSIAAAKDARIGDSTFFYQRQLIFLGIGVVGLAVMAFIDYRRLVRMATSVYVVAALLLLAVMVFGTTANNATRWIRLGPVSFQPSEFAKLAIVIAAAAFAAAKASKISSLKSGFVPACLLVAPICGLIIQQPDLGTAVFVGAIGMGVLIVGGMRLRHVGLVAGLAMPAVVVLMFLKFNHVQDRILVFMDPEADLRGKGHQIYQSLIAMGSGGFWGKGLGESTQKLFFLPEEHTDFIFAIVVEELGFVGGAAIIMLFAALAWAGARIAKHAPDPQGTLVVFGITAAIVVQAAMNIAVVTASVPTKGISLPFISFGGTGLVIALAGVGIVINVARQSVTREQAAKLRNQTWEEANGISTAPLPKRPSKRGSGRSRGLLGGPISGPFPAPVPMAISSSTSAALATVMGEEPITPRAATRRKLHLSTTDLDDLEVNPEAEYDPDPLPDFRVSIRSNRVAYHNDDADIPTDQSTRIDITERVTMRHDSAAITPESELARAIDGSDSRAH